MVVPSNDYHTDCEQTLHKLARDTKMTSNDSGYWTDRRIAIAALLVSVATLLFALVSWLVMLSLDPAHLLPVNTDGSQLLVQNAGERNAGITSIEFLPFYEPHEFQRSTEVVAIEIKPTVVTFKDEDWIPIDKLYRQKLSLELPGKNVHFFSVTLDSTKYSDATKGIVRIRYNNKECDFQHVYIDNIARLEIDGPIGQTPIPGRLGPPVPAIQLEDDDVN